MAEKRKFTYQDALDLAHKTAEEEQKALPQYQEQALGYRRDIVDVLGDEINGPKDALQFMRDFALCCDDRSIRDKRIKDMPWAEIYRTFFTTLGVSRKNSAGRKWSLKTVKTACDMIHGTDTQDFFEALDKTSMKNKEYAQAHEFLKAVETSFVKHGYLKKAA